MRHQDRDGRSQSQTREEEEEVGKEASAKLTSNPTLLEDLLLES